MRHAGCTGPIARLRAPAAGFTALADKLDELRRTLASSDTELMRRLVEDGRSWSPKLDVNACFTSVPVPLR
ncbi:hypothetical protein [uncultured Mycobacterium sp.]|uniref:hypothetical protein n=1 Tax=uncultured Mycobacterium sp. TaxID=171292 RepID=UPI0035CC6D34